MGRIKTELRLAIEEYVKGTNKDIDGWLEIKFTTKDEHNKIKSTISNVMNAMHVKLICKTDYSNKIVWICRQ